MQDFIHNKVKLAEEMLVQFNQVQRLYAQRAYEFDQNFDDFMKVLLLHYTQSGDTTSESEILRLSNSVSLVKKGFNPLKMEKITSGRREYYFGFTFSAMESIHALLTEEFTLQMKKLDDAAELISNLILSMHQNGILTDKKIKNLNSVAKIEAFWNSMVNQNESVSSIYKKLRLTLISEDIYLLTEKILLKII
ncbi:hypothetical protein H1R16_09455 [Marnyiella aurantia]|uniref:Uncharacterized protein n=1 Tax=Marnyiella aurantia TaxID=2758037 RepID=A0A7D7LLW2_9FLAO|nr:hypothetical protein [Marnyiella aurantia]MBA5246711.1 hypothetical protein [Marnyiella aurantia]QMS97939.1 hypothetical protein H1R16_09455 [Marnyiella aurantia]